MSDSKLNQMDIIEKANALIYIKDDPFDLAELKLLDAYLSKINARDPSYMTVRFSKREFENIVGVDRIRNEVMQKYIDSIMRVINIKSGDEWIKIVLFSGCKCTRDESGQYWIEMTCSNEAKEYFFNIESIGYLKYRLGNIIHLSSKYSIHFFLYCMKNMYRKKWTVNIDDIRKAIHCTSKTCRQYKYFNNNVLSKAATEINKYTDINISYSAIYGANHTVTGIELNVGSVISQKEAIKIAANNSCSDSTLTDADIFKTLKEKINCDDKTANLIIARAKEYSVNYTNLNIYITYVSSNAAIKNKIGYLITLIQKKIEIGENGLKKGSFADFSEREYDDNFLMELEELLLEEINGK